MPETYEQLAMNEQYLVAGMCPGCKTPILDHGTEESMKARTSNCVLTQRDIPRWFGPPQVQVTQQQVPRYR